MIATRVLAASDVVTPPCKGRPDLFFGPDGEHGSEKAERERCAKAICATCSLTGQCLDDALEIETGLGLYAIHGVWGGLTAEERMPIVRMRQADGGRPRSARCANNHKRTDQNTHRRPSGKVVCTDCTKATDGRRAEKRAA